jgi:hypothetical protein
VASHRRAHHACPYETDNLSQILPLPYKPKYAFALKNYTRIFNAFMSHYIMGSEAHATLFAARIAALARFVGSRGMGKQIFYFSG